MCGLMSDLMICKFRKKYGHTWHRIPFLRRGVIKQHKTKPILILIIVLYTFSEEAELNGSTGKQDTASKGLLHIQQHPSAMCSLGSAVGCRVEGRAIGSTLGHIYKSNMVCD